MKHLKIIAEKDKVIEQLVTENKDTEKEINRLMLENKDTEKEINRLLLENKDTEKENNRLMSENKDTEKKINRLKTELLNLQFQLEQLNKIAIGRKSGKLSKPTKYVGQPDLFDSQQLEEKETPSQEKHNISKKQSP